MKKGSLSRRDGKRVPPKVTPRNSDSKENQQGSSGAPGQTPRVVVDDQRPSTSRGLVNDEAPTPKRPRNGPLDGKDGEDSADATTNPPRPKVFRQQSLFTCITNFTKKNEAQTLTPLPPPPADPINVEEDEDSVILSDTEDANYVPQIHDEDDSEDDIFLSDFENDELLADEDLVGEEEGEQEQLVEKIYKENLPTDKRSRLLITKGKNLYANWAILEFFEKQTTPFSRDLATDSLVVELFLRKAGSNMQTDMISWRPSARTRPAQYMIRKGTNGNFKTISSHLVSKGRAEKPDQIVDEDEDEEESDGSDEATKPEEIQRVYEDSLPLDDETLAKISKASNPKANMNVLLFIEERTTRFSKNREVEVAIIKMFLNNAGSNISPTRIVWKVNLSKNTRKKRRFLHQPKYLLAFSCEGKICHMALKDYVKGCENKRHRIYAGVCIAAKDLGSPPPQEKEDLLKVLLDDKDVSLSLYLGKCTNITKSVTDVNRYHFNHPYSSILQHMAEGERKICLSVFSMDLSAAKEQEDFESFCIKNLTALKDPRIKPLNKKYGAKIHSEKVLKAIELGRRGIGLLNFESADGHVPEDPYDLNFSLNVNHLKDVTNRFRLEKADPVHQPEASDELHSVYIVVVFPETPADKKNEKPSFKSLLDGKARPMSVYIGRCLQEYLRHGVREGHFRQKNRELLNMAEAGCTVFRVRTFMNLTLQESKDLESFIIFYAFGYEDAAVKIANGDPTFQCLNKWYGAVISSDLVYDAVSLGLSFQQFFVEGYSSDIFSLPIHVRESDFVDITAHFEV